MWHGSAKLKNLSVARLSQAKKNLSVPSLIQLQPRVISNDFHWLFGSQSKHIDFVVYPRTHGQTHKATYEQFSVAAAQKCSNTTKMGFCKCRHLLTIKSIFLIFFMLLVWLCKRPNLKYERKLKFLKIFHKSRNFRVGIFDTLKIPRFMKYFENF